MLQKYVNTMALFASNNKNVHRELKEYTASTKMLLSQFVLVKQKEKTSPPPEPHTTSIENFKEELTEEIKNLRELITKQSEDTFKLIMQVESLPHSKLTLINVYLKFKIQY
jgi:D-Tyr-tRNAtyr deacylase